MVALVDAIINAQMFTKWLYNGEPAAALEDTLDGGLDVRLEWAP